MQMGFLMEYLFLKKIKLALCLWSFVGLSILGLFLLITPSLGSETTHNYDKQQTKLDKKLPLLSFMGFIYLGDGDSNPDLDFVIRSQENPDQNYLVDNIQNQPFKYIHVHRNYEKKRADLLNKIRLEVNKCLKERNNKVIIFGRYSSDPDLTQEKYDAFIELTAIFLYDKDGKMIPYNIEGVIGGIRACVEYN